MSTALQDAALDEVNNRLGGVQKPGAGSVAKSDKHDSLLTARDLVVGGFGEKDNLFSVDSIKRALSTLSGKAVLERGQQLANYIGTTNPEENRESLKGTLRKLAYDKEGGKVFAKEFERKLSNIYGAVLTGHPVFSKSEEAYGKLAAYATLLASGKNDAHIMPEIEKARKELLETLKKPFLPLSLDQESDLSIKTIENIHNAISIVEETAIEVAQEEYPQEWKDINYMPASAATWIPFDWDGRTDITWQKALEKRLILQRKMLTDDILPRLERLQEALEKREQKDAVSALIVKTKFTYGKLDEHIEFLKNYDQSADKDGSILANWEKKVEEDKAIRITHPDVLINPLQQILDQGTNNQAEKLLVHMRSRLMNHGISFAQVHFRVNSKVEERVMCQEFGIKEGMPPGEVDTICAAKIEKCLNEVEQVKGSLSSKNVTYNDLANAQNIPIRQKMLIRKIFDHFDNHSPVRYLIAETHNVTVPLYALYIAKLLDIDVGIRVCTLTEDKTGTDLFKSTVDGMYSSAHYINHIFKQHYHGAEACFQLGYSDSGREIGQFSAGDNIDHTAHRIVKKHSQKLGKGDARLTIFHTHGESIGRGAHPGGVAKRLAYQATPHFINYAAERGVKVKIEESFQGGDGFLLHGTPEASLAYLSQALTHLTADHRGAKNDIYYSIEHCEERKGLKAFFAASSLKHIKLFAQDMYKSMILHFKALIPKTGSRSDKRQGGHAGQLRAIPHNGSLLQVGVQTPGYYGSGSTSLEHAEIYRKFMKESPEFSRRREMEEYAMGMDDPAILDAYVELYNPAFWEKMARNAPNRGKKETYRKITDYMKRFDHYGEYAQVVREIYRDYEDSVESRIQFGNTKSFQQESSVSEGTRNPLLSEKNHQKNITHTFRLASMMRLFEYAASIPEIAEGEIEARDDIIYKIMHLNPEGLTSLKNIFEAAKNGRPKTEKTSLVQILQTDYSHIRDELIRPMEELMDIIKNRTSHIVMDLNGYVG